MNIGIFLGYGPHVKLGKEGLGRYLAGLVKGFQTNGSMITIAMPKWSTDTINALFEDFEINPSNIEIITTRREPVAWKLFDAFSQKRKNRHRWNFNTKVINAVIEYLSKVTEVKSPIVFAIGVLPIPLLIIAIVFVLVLIFNKIYLAISIKIIVFFAMLITIACLVAAVCLVIYKRKLSLEKKEEFKDDVQIFNRRAKSIPIKVFKKMCDSEVDELMRIINSKQHPDVWFVPSIFWPQIKKIENTPVVINVPDLVTQEFPEKYADKISSNSVSSCRETIENGKYFITYSDFIKYDLLMNQYNKEKQDIVTIKHVNNDLSQYLRLVDTVTSLGNNVDWELKYAHEILGNRIKEDVKYIFYASQIRPNKNVLSLVKAYEFLLRRKYIKHKLLLTGDYSIHKEIKEYITNQQLENDIIIFNNVPAKTLAALYKCADLAVNPTLYEGGFPFTFCEAMSVGTPCILSDIPQTREEIEPAGLTQVLFDPYDYLKIAEKIGWALQNLDDLYKIELPLYERMSSRTYGMVADEYVRTFEMFTGK